MIAGRRFDYLVLDDVRSRSWLPGLRESIFVEEPDPVRLRGSLVARYVRKGCQDLAAAVHPQAFAMIAAIDYVRRALEHDRRFELTADDVACACAAGGTRAVYELWTGESGAWADPRTERLAAKAFNLRR